MTPHEYTAYIGKDLDVVVEVSFSYMEAQKGDSIDPPAVAECVIDSVVIMGSTSDIIDDLCQEKIYRLMEECIEKMERIETQWDWFNN